MKVKAIAQFHDLEADVDRKAGDVFEVAAERFKAINSTQYGKLVEEVKAAKKAPAKKKEAE